MTRRPFTSEEDATIRELASVGTAELLRRMPYRTAGSIQNRALRLGLKLGSRPATPRSSIDGHQRAEILRQCRFHANDKVIADYVGCEVAAVTRVRAQMPKGKPDRALAPMAGLETNRVKIAAGSAALRDRILAHEAKLAKRHGVSAGDARIIAVHGRAALTRLSSTTSTKGQDHA